MFSIREWIILLLPMIACFTASAVCPIGKTAGNSVVFRPPAWVFGIVWFIITIMLGLSWVIALKQNDQTTSKLPISAIYTIYGFLVGFLVWWIIQYGCNKDKISATWIFVPLIMTALMCMVIGSTISRLLVCPLIAWLIFALLLATTEINQQSHPSV